MKGCPKFLTEYPNGKCAYHLQFFTAILEYDQVELILGFPSKLGVVVVNGKWPI